MEIGCFYAENAQVSTRLSPPCHHDQGRDVGCKHNHLNERRHGSTLPNSSTFNYMLYPKRTEITYRPTQHRFTSFWPELLHFHGKGA
jgi:hypothetical protein